MVETAERVGVSEFARSKSWRDKLPGTGCFEVVDRGNVIGYLLAPDYAEALSGRITELEEQVERAQIAAMFSARAERDNPQTGTDLKEAALAYFDANADALKDVVNGN
ncbi:hypothetical protein GMI69_03650 [Eggerthellaceae bacterium zg-887]|uniref:hypothetical protein n=1 Tax=Xiamenia xianingshaonis TaxID=2682776 RepID=UPI00140B7DCD|nr:hypothetical protein [Xiamenia xianingshaonis]NHM15767.1 hypothetical protein [Xiamenia xianingshaonis]